jgi:oligopeptide transport system substrate-binding protein
MRRRWLAVGAALLQLMACDGQRPPASGAMRADAVAARVAAAHLFRHITQSPRTLDPSLNEDVAAYAIADDLFEGLVRLDAAGNVVPAVAERWEVSPDGLLWRFHLRHDALWSNGDAVAAADFVFAWRRVLAPETASPLAQQLAPIAGAAAILTGAAQPATLAATAIDAQTLEVRLASSTPYFLYLLTNCWMLPLHEPTLRKFGVHWTDPENLVGNGPFLLHARTINGPVELRRNPLFRDAAHVNLQSVTYVPVPDTAAATARFLAGDLDLSDRFQLDDLPWLRASLGDQVRLEPYFGTFMLAMDVQRAPFNDQRLRRALQLAVDRDILAGKLLKGRFEPAYAVVPPLPDVPALRPAWADLADATRHAQAQQLYAAAGYSRSHPLRVELWYPTADADTRRVLEAVVAMWRMNLGAEVRLANEEWRVHQQNRRIHKHRLFLYAWIGDYPDPLTFLALPLPDGGQNYMRYRNAAYAGVIAGARQAVQREQRLGLYRAAGQILDEDALVIPLYYYRSRHLLRSYVQGWHDNPMDRHASRDLRLALPVAN